MKGDVGNQADQLIEGLNLNTLISNQRMFQVQLR